MNEAFEKILERLDDGVSIPKMNGMEIRVGKMQTQGFGIGVLFAKDIVKEVAKEYNGGWIACSERLPEPIRPVLVTLKNWMNDKCFVRVGRFHTDHWKTDEGIVENSVVIAWQPLPEPYKERD